jgi:ssDNA-binding Zn-finger/Zn-ribbon topoisomerase 1
MTKTQLWTGENEELSKVLEENAGVCDGCNKQLVLARFRWSDWKSDSFDLPVGGRFTAYRHKDGTPDCQEYPSPKPMCPECGGTELRYDDTGYGTVSSCPCGWSRYIDRGN